MGGTRRGAGDPSEACRSCGRETPHTVSIEIRTESDKPHNTEYSREPYRVSTCRVCGEETTLRMNNE
jgi:ribosomal protein L40E